MKKPHRNPSLHSHRLRAKPSPRGPPPARGYSPKSRDSVLSVLPLVLAREPPVSAVVGHLKEERGGAAASPIGVIPRHDLLRVRTPVPAAFFRASRPTPPCPGGLRSEAPASSSRTALRCHHSTLYHHRPSMI
jgi:hypothetical protein